jgi:hypothetical protein
MRLYDLYKLWRVYFRRSGTSFLKGGGNVILIALLVNLALRDHDDVYGCLVFRILKLPYLELLSLV